MKLKSYNTVMWYIYILLCRDRSLYTGITDNPKRRFQEHKSGKGSRYTRSHKPVKIIHLEKHKTKSEALKREMEIKAWRREEKITKFHLGKYIYNKRKL
ncbi:hypothetical protein A2Y99_04515 [Candidatus Gottesmanbacteria bacterium RBG_13_37_7]|uniref:GIY-YIG domain-containing protein n=1 Tax=Candidatus Gottesmanbacteria bacterium RBG_13_37_7 TaxID=1798369 RepID=A0A1F5YGC2_9BACT|nr:MAG: hypothetical protein A2Y99_04515 [Candidatus Gottesmanbacteria bacterium RBG_13_37_7]